MPTCSRAAGTPLVFISEAMHPYNVFKKAGIEVDFTSETGKYVPDWLSQQPDFLGSEDKKEWEDLQGEFRQKLDHQLYKPDQVDASKVSFGTLTSSEMVVADGRTVWSVLCLSRSSLGAHGNIKNT
jgi:putative intracellular protease/amidase